MDERGRLEILMEQQAARLDAIFELVSDLPAIRETQREHSAELRAHGAELREIKADLRELTGLVGGHAEAITELAAKAHTH